MRKRLVASGYHLLVTTNLFLLPTLPETNSSRYTHKKLMVEKEDDPLAAFWGQ